MNKENSAGVVAPPPLIFMTGLGLGILLDLLLDGTVPPLARGLGAVLVLFGLALGVSFMQQFRRAGTALEPWKPSTALVTDGIYGHTRNPAYLGMTMWAAGLALILAAPWALAGVALAVAVVDRGVIAREERYLERVFGEEYLAYKARVRRWL